MYLGFVLILAGIALLFGTLSPWIAVPVFAVLMESVFIQDEERMLEARFGQEWIRNKGRVKPWL